MAALAAISSLAAPPDPPLPARAPVATDLLNTTHELVGPLGQPLGEVLTVTVKVEKVTAKDVSHWLLVTGVNGQPLNPALRMTAEVWPWANVKDKDLPAGAELKLRVFQDGGMIGTPAKVMSETGVVIATRAYAFQTWLVVIGKAK